MNRIIMTEYLCPNKIERLNQSMRESDKLKEKQTAYT